MTRYDTTKMYPLDATVGRWFGRGLGLIGMIAAAYLIWRLM